MWQPECKTLCQLNSFKPPAVLLDLFHGVPVDERL
jgi:hypothetical protein